MVINTQPMTGTELKLFRIGKLSIKQYELAQALGVTRNTVMKWEKASSVPPLVGLAVVELSRILEAQRNWSYTENASRS